MENLKQRILTGWTFTRGLYVFMGTFIIFTSVQSQQWFGIVLGTYFASMGVFSFGCVGGSCRTEPNRADTSQIDDVEFEEVKGK